MNKAYTIIGIVIVIVLVCFIAYKAVPHIIKSNISSQKSEPQPLPKEVDVTLNKNGFSPKVVTISVGSAVVWKNISGTKETVNSDNYPTNQLYKELNFGVFANGSSVSYIFKTPGTYGYHNQFHHTQNGKIIVVQ